MIVLDEQLLGRDIEVELSRWYRGSVCFVTDLRPNTIIKDEAIPHLLRKQRQPTFVTINESDFWRRIRADRKYCIICFALSDSRANQIPEKLKTLLRKPEFRSKAKRMGKVIRFTEQSIRFYV